MAKLDQWAKYDATGAPEDEPYYINGVRFHLPPDQIRAKGKVGDLAFGYMGGIGAWRKFAGDDDPTSDTEIKGYQKAWRDAHPETSTP